MTLDRERERERWKVLGGYIVHRIPTRAVHRLYIVVGFTSVTTRGPCFDTSLFMGV